MTEVKFSKSKMMIFVLIGTCGLCDNITKIFCRMNNVVCAILSWLPQILSSIELRIKLIPRT